MLISSLSLLRWASDLCSSNVSNGIQRSGIAELSGRSQPAHSVASALEEVGEGGTKAGQRFC